MSINIKNNRIGQIIKLSRQAFGPYKRQIITLTALGFISGILEGIGVNALIPLFSFAMGDGSGGDDVISRTIEKFFLYFNVTFSLKYLLVFICLLLVFKAIVLIVIGYITLKITTDYEAKTRSELFKKTLNSNWPYLLKQKLGYLETVLMVDVQHSSNLLKIISTSIMMLAGLSIYTLVAINISVPITLVTLILGGVVFLVFKPLIYRMRIVAHRTADMNKEIAHFVNENILGLKTIKSMIADNSVAEIGKKYFVELKELRIRSGLFSNIIGSLMQPISLIFICIVFAVSYKLPGFSFAALIAVIYLIQRIFQYIRQAQSNLQSVNEAYPYLKSVLNYQEYAKKNEEKSRGSGGFRFDQRLEFKNVHFSYDPKKKVLAGIDFSIRRGEMVGLIGPSGTGKTTIVDLILRLFDPGAGAILMDSKDISEISIQEWRNNIGYVSQDIFLTNDTIANNIRFYDTAISDSDLEQVARMANIYDFIQSRAQKWETIIGDRGVLLSAGQRQRLIIARVLARKPKLLILDEATSALDNESEVKIQKVIENLKGKITVFVVAHRLSTVINSDRLLVLEGGKIIEQGAPTDLLQNKKSYFYKVYNIRE